ncbi:MAG TPA: hypothetical protein VE964_17910 [Myxococcales bacterium]|nr:hypothetical protein [Myxococcales bacterium]
MARVVLVGRSGELREAVGRILAEENISVHAEDDIPSAIARMAELTAPPDLVLLDRSLARGHEADLIEYVRSSARLQDVPVVLYAVEASGARGQRAVDDDLREAFDARLVLAIVEAICR